MSDYEVGYLKPPKASQFIPGQSGNPRGRPKKKPAEVENLVNQFLDAPMDYHEGGRRKTGSRREVAVKQQREKALKGDIKAAEWLLAMRKHAMKHGEKGIERLIVTDWLPDYPGQTGDQKVLDMEVADLTAGQESRAKDSTDHSHNGDDEPSLGEEN